MLWREISSRLTELQVPESFACELRSHLLPSVTGALLYGSWARGDTHPESDLDVLLLTTGASISIPSDRLSVSYYSPTQLRAASGTLFGLHLARDGIILADRDGELERAIKSFESPDPQELMNRIRHLSKVLAAPLGDHLEQLPGLVKVGRYLLRSALYGKALALGQPCFSVHEISAREGDPGLISVLSSHKALQPEPTAEHLKDLRKRLAAVVGVAPTEDVPPLEALAVAAWESDRDLSNLATLALANDDDPLAYSEIDKVVL